MLLEVKVFKDFWGSNPFEKQLSDLLEPIGKYIPQSSIRKMSAVDDYESKITRKVGAFMLALSALLLCVCGYDSGFVSIPVSGDYLPVLFVLMYSFIIWVFRRLLFFHWGSVTIAICLLPLLYWIVAFNNCSVIILNSPLIIWLYKHIREIIITILLLPIIERIVTNWLQTNIRRAYMRENLEKEIIDYSNAVNGIKQRSSTNVKKYYITAWKRDYFSGTEGSDGSMTHVNEVFSKRIRRVLSPRKIVLFVSFIKHKCQVIWRWGRGLFIGRQISDSLED